MENDSLTIALLIAVIWQMKRLLIFCVYSGSRIMHGYLLLVKGCYTLMRPVVGISIAYLGDGGGGQRFHGSRGGYWRCSIERELISDNTSMSFSCVLRWELSSIPALACLNCLRRTSVQES